MSKSAPTRSRTLNWPSYNAALCRRGSLTVWFDPSTPWHAAPSGKRGAQPVYSDAAIQACLTVNDLPPVWWTGLGRHSLHVGW